MKERRIVILAEGEFSGESAKTAHGVLRYGPDAVVAVIDSTLAGRRVGDVMAPNARYGDVPIVASLDAAWRMPEPPTTLLIGIAPAGGKLPDAWRSDRAAGAAALAWMSSAGCTSFSETTMSSGRRPPAPGVEIVDLRRPPERMEIARGPPASAGQARGPDGRHRLRDRQDERRARTAKAAPPPRVCGRSSCRPARPA